MQRVFTSKWCDWPGCSKEAIAQGAEITKGQVTRQIQSWFYPPGKGHKPRVISNDLCDIHFEEVIQLRDKLKVHGELVAGDPQAIVSSGNGE